MYDILHNNTHTTNNANHNNNINDSNNNDKGYAVMRYRITNSNHTGCARRGRGATASPPCRGTPPICVYIYIYIYIYIIATLD